MTNPHLFAVALPLCGSRQMTETLRDAGGSPRHTEVAGWGHDVWIVAYRNSEAPRWLLSQ